MDRQELLQQDPIIAQFDRCTVGLSLAVFLLTSYNYPSLPAAILFYIIRATFFLLLGSILYLATLIAVVIWRSLDLKFPTNHRTGRPQVSNLAAAEKAAAIQRNPTRSDETVENATRGRRQAKNLEIDAWLDDQASASTQGTNQHASNFHTIHTQHTKLLSTSRSRSLSRQRRIRKPKERSLSPRPAPDYIHPLMARSEFERINFSAEPPRPKSVMKKKGKSKKSAEQGQGLDVAARSAVTMEEGLVDRLGRLEIV